eukprot:CAMPEP_0116132308 /NCGR_PEP_ID=MMETSP0329-20121206/9476_1 /TAXON_ID=697910 /ORGANISM="Pseudo-nitzschia arenysensis, Strain B593" /LENGTH=848 /DNA_ID=CAMNT_0003626809 /DNA_START=94 /DNA_END=2640 /DNA_ORIENTATION=+
MTRSDEKSGEDNFLGDTIDALAETANDSGEGGLCRDPRHLHCFRSVPFIVLPRFTCAGCGGRIQPYVLQPLTGSTSPNAAVECMACGVYAHRRCSFSKYIKWESKCTAAGDDNNELTIEDAEDKAESSTSEPTEDIKIDETMDCVQPMLSDCMDPKLSLESPSNLSASPEDDTSSDYISFNSIFRKSPSNASPNRRANVPTIKIAASVDDAFTQTTRDHGQDTKANFPFLSSAKLLPSKNATDKENIPEIRKCQTWNGVIDSTSIYNYESKKDITMEEDESSDGERDVGTNDDADEQDTTDGENGPLHFATHGFKAFAKALQENIVDNFTRFIPKDDSKDEESPDKADSANIPDLERDDSSSVADAELAEPTKSSEEATNDDKDDTQARSLLETSKPQKESGMDRKKIGLATVAGTIVGGVVGVGLAGPVGGVIGVKCGQTAGMLGLLLEGSVTASVVASGIGVGLAAGQHIEEQHETRILALGEGTKQRVLLMVRPSIQAPEPIWDEIYQQARKSHSGNNHNIVSMIIPNESRAAKRERYEREVDIVETGEDELAIADKVLLLASRILSNKESLPGHVYRKLIEAFRTRCDELNLRDLSLHEPKKQKTDEASSDDGNLSNATVDNDDENPIEDERFAKTHQRRRDAHAVIKYVTTSLLLTRPGFGHSSSLTEKTATAVESLVFGEIYNLVMDEIVLEYESQDNRLLDKIADFDKKQSQRENPIEDYKSFISEAALEALHCLPQAHSAVDKLRYCVVFLEQISDKFSKSENKSAMGADSLLKMVCQHILVAKVMGINSQIAFLEEFARDEQLLRGREGYALVTLQASLHFLNASEDFETDIFSHDDED